MRTQIKFIQQPLTDSQGREQISSHALFLHPNGHGTVFLNSIDNPFDLIKDYLPVNAAIISDGANLKKGDSALFAGQIINVIEMDNQSVTFINPFDEKIMTLAGPERFKKVELYPIKLTLEIG